MRRVVPKDLMVKAVSFTGRSEKTLIRWHLAGCDLSSETELETWMRRMDSRPRGIWGAQMRVAAADPAAGKPQPQSSPRKKGAVSQNGHAGLNGAAGALRRLQELEQIFFDRQMQALNGDRADLTSFALNDYQRICEVMRRFEKEVALSMRDTGELISKGDAIEGAKAMMRCFRLTFLGWLSSSTPDLLPLAGDALAYKAKALATFSESIEHALKQWANAAEPVPEWIAEIVIAGFLRKEEAG